MATEHASQAVRVDCHALLVNMQASDKLSSVSRIAFVSMVLSVFVAR